ANRLMSEDCIVLALVRARSKEEAELRLRRAWWDFPELRMVTGSRVQVLQGDVNVKNLGLDEATYSSLANSLTHIVHSAADLRLNASLEELNRTNVEGTSNVLALAERAQADHGLQRFAHVSTAYVAGNKEGTVYEDALGDFESLDNNYERSKHLGEKMVRDHAGKLPISIFRPGMVVGDSLTGRIKTFNVIYYPLRLYLTGRIRFFPISSHARVNLMPVDLVADALVRLMLDPKAEGITFHLTAPAEGCPEVGELVDAAREWAKENLNIRLAKPLFVPVPRGAVNTFLKVGAKGEASNLSQLSSYFTERREFSRANAENLLGTPEFQWQKILPHMLEYAAYTGFLHRSGRTVHEQVLIRLGQQKRRIACHDIVEGKVVDLDSASLRRDILRAASALAALGVKKGDRVAVVGWNSSRYLTIEEAIGLAGAVSVPLYYTSPPADIAELVHASGAKVLFVGTNELLKRADEIERSAKVVSFCRACEGKPDDVLDWNEFLSLGTDREISLANVAPEDLATIRYTSSTTGKAKGVRFTHEHLAYMAESMASLPPWGARNHPIRYLSYLPMNHVVEGLLATYGPYYAPTSVDIYFLEEFKALRDSLPLVRPTVFFSVPRFYERLWDTIKQSKMGEKAMRKRSGLLSGLQRSIVGRAALKRAGLDECQHLIVGSGPMGNDILTDLERLGIVVHNAYGLTEAPLVTLNRKGRNRIGSVGEPLPMTEVATAEDGEVLVRGPQVTSGYHDYEGQQPFRDGWLLTGDLGKVEDDYLYIQGRKKELIKTSYGKFVSPMRVESMLRDSPLLAEALIVGEGKPYCIALLWPEGEWNAELAKKIDETVREVNARLSQPERPRRWAVVKGKLSVESGELTANLKLRRPKVEVRYAELISAIYAGVDSHPDALHVGEEAEK
ncbi:MAG: AMP-binding protein, partial [Methanomassiliicoccales archaeon]|nr:AMP-binding protein [Methanomassiliicoccales archaeon]